MNRLKKLRLFLKRENQEAILITSRSNCRYLCGFTGSNGYLLVTRDSISLFTDSRYLIQAENECSNISIFPISQGYTSLRDLLVKSNIRNMGFEFHDISHATYTEIASSIGGLVSLIPQKYVIEKLRSVKEPTEIEFIQRAVEIADQGMSAISNLLEPGMTELDVAFKLEQIMRDNGSESLAFDTIVGVGENAAIPHHRPSDTAIQKGDQVVIDMGAVYMGYRSDLTRTFHVGPINAKFREIYNLVLNAQLASEEQARPGMKGSEVDSIARDVISRGGYAQFFSHGLGHGVGIDIHEKPMVTQSSRDEIEVGSVFTVEPGVYIAGWGGIRLEDMLVMENNSARLLTKSSKYIL